LIARTKISISDPSFLRKPKFNRGDVLLLGLRKKEGSLMLIFVLAIKKHRSER